MTIVKLCRAFVVVLTVILGLSSSVALFGQSGQADVQGVVTDPTGSVVVGAQVVLTNTDSGDARTVTTASDGRYSIPTVPPGHYSISVTARTFSPITISGLVIQLDNHVNQNVTMKVGSESQIINVTGTVPAVDTTSYDVGGLVDQTQIDSLPIPNRQYLALALLTPGTTQAASRSFYSNVQSGGGIYFYASGFSWDGVSNQQTEEGDPRQNIPEDAVGEFKTYTASMPADLGWAMGGYTALVTKSGTNKVHGDVFEYYRGTFMNADNQFQKAIEATQGTGKSPYLRNQYGGSVGGPIFKNKTHYFGAYERTQATTSWTLFEPAGSAAAADYASLLGTFSAPQHDQLIVGRVDHNLTTSQQLFFRASFEEQLATAQGCGGTTTNGCYDGQFPRKAYVGGHTWEPTPRIVNEARFQYAYISYELGPYNTPPPKKPTDFLDPAYAKNISIGYSFASLNYGHTYAADGVESRWQVNDSLTIQKGAHSIKVGGDISYVPYTDAVATTLNGSFSFTVDMPFDNTPATINKLCTTLTVACPSAFTQNATPLLYFLPSTQQAYFIQDSWKAKSNLTLNFGLRYDLQRGSAFLNTYTPTVAPPKFPAIPFEGNPHDRGDWNNFGPRLGFSWDPNKKGTNVIRGGYGIYYNFIETELTEAEKLNFVACPITMTSSTTNQVQYPNPYNGQSVTSFCAATKNVNVTILSPGFSNPYQHQFSLGYSRQINSSTSLAVDGLYTRGLRDYKIYDQNLPPNYPAVVTATTRPNTNMAQIQQHASTGASEYLGLYFKLSKTLSHHYMYTAAYALSSAHDNSPHAAPVNYFAQQADWGQSGVDQRNAIVVSGTYEIPKVKILVGGIYSYRSRMPFSVTSTTLSPNVFPGGLVNPNFNGTAQYIPGTTRGQGNRSLNYAAINAYRADLNATNKTYSGWSNGTTGSGTIVAGTTGCAVNAPGVGNCLSTNLSAANVTTNRYKDFDLRVSKAVFQHESMRLEIIGQAFNLFGTENYTTITTSPTLNTFGVPTAANTVQIGELAAKFTF
jgi:carboxypeptidase family protein